MPAIRLFRKLGIRGSGRELVHLLLGGAMISNSRAPINERKRRSEKLVGSRVRGFEVFLEGIKIGYLEGQSLPVTRARQRVIPQSRPSFSRSFEIYDRTGSINRSDRGRMLALPLIRGYRRGCHSVVSIGRRKLSTD